MPGLGNDCRSMGAACIRSVIGREEYSPFRSIGRKEMIESGRGLDQQTTCLIPPPPQPVRIQTPAPYVQASSSPISFRQGKEEVGRDQDVVYVVIQLRSC
jgi:hypothetical protein